jgi:hypothetical protein
MWHGAVGAFFGEESGGGAFEICLLLGLLALAAWAIWEAGEQPDSRRMCSLGRHLPR